MSEFLYTGPDGVFWKTCIILEEEEETYTIKYYNSFLKGYMEEKVQKGRVYKK